MDLFLGYTQKASYQWRYLSILIYPWSSPFLANVGLWSYTQHRHTCILSLNNEMEIWWFAEMYFGRVCALDLFYGYVFDLASPLDFDFKLSPVNLWLVLLFAYMPQLLYICLILPCPNKLCYKKREHIIHISTICSIYLNFLLLLRFCSFFCRFFALNDCSIHLVHLLVLQNKM